MPWWTWLALGILLLSIAGTAIFAVFAYGHFKRLAASAEGIRARVDDLARMAEELESKSTHAQARVEELQRHRDHLDEALGRFSVLTWAVSDARKNLTRLRESYLRK